MIYYQEAMLPQKQIFFYMFGVDFIQQSWMSHFSAQQRCVYVLFSPICAKAIPLARCSSLPWVYFVVTVTCFSLTDLNTPPQKHTVYIKTRWLLLLYSADSFSSCFSKKLVINRKYGRKAVWKQDQILGGTLNVKCSCFSSSVVAVVMQSKITSLVSVVWLLQSYNLHILFSESFHNSEQ